MLNLSNHLAITKSSSVEHIQDEQHTADVSEVITMDSKVRFEVANSNIWLNHLATTTIIQVRRISSRYSTHGIHRSSWSSAQRGIKSRRWLNHRCSCLSLRHCNNLHIFFLWYCGWRFKPLWWYCDIVHVVVKLRRRWCRMSKLHSLVMQLVVDLMAGQRRRAARCSSCNAGCVFSIRCVFLISSSSMLSLPLVTWSQLQDLFGQNVIGSSRSNLILSHDNRNACVKNPKGWPPFFQSLFQLGPCHLNPCRRKQTKSPAECGPRSVFSWAILVCWRCRPASKSQNGCQVHFRRWPSIPTDLVWYTHWLGVKPRLILMLFLTIAQHPHVMHANHLPFFNCWLRNLLKNTFSFSPPLPCFKTLIAK